ncbi:hypothetical protein [Portibacter lacus]|uniref:Uncharacterized protein n=1 Tax=Portibacter lacus TaxID=1099794 RepID=A0AA37SRN8_9BACT|nr:hypothetical protein [Portibacter lacus]GLR16700.1 hypothetical protein GCM10007940_13150 [Portibacter lacus]
MKKMFRNIVPHIIPEFKLLLFKILPAGMVLSIFFITSEAQYLIRDELKLILYGVLLGVAGIYLMRIIAYFILRIMTQIPYIIPDIFHDESKNQ